VTRFVDVHVHPPLAEFLEGAFAPFIDGLRAEFRSEIPAQTIDEIANHYRSLDGMAVLLAWDAERATRRPAFTGARVAELVAQHPDVFVGFGSVDPLNGAAAVAGVHGAIRLGLKGLKFHPPAQRFSPADRRVYPVWEAAESLRLPVLIHTGYTAMGAGMPGGGGIELSYGDPTLVDRVAVDFPNLQIVLAHPSWPWQEQAIAMAQHKANVHLELSGWSPSRFPASLVEAIKGPLTHKTLFGTDYPFLTPERWIASFEKLGFTDEATQRILRDNASELLGLEGMVG
jgi:hypothetical protein